MELVWFGDRPAHKRKNYDDPAMQAFWQSARTAGIDIREKLNERAASLNDNVPAAVGVPTVNFNVGTNAGGGEKDAVSQEAYEQVATEYEKLMADIELVKANIAQTELRAPFDGII